MFEKKNSINTILQKFILESEKLTKEAEKLNSDLTYKISNGMNGHSKCIVKFNANAGIPYIYLEQYDSHRSYDRIKLSLDETRKLMLWLKSVGIE